MHLKPTEVDLELADDGGSAHEPRRRATRSAQDRLDSRRDLVRMARLRDPVIGSEVERTNAIADGADRGDDDQSELWRLPTQLLDVAEGVRPELRRVEHDRAQPLAEEVVGIRRRAVDYGLPAKAFDAVRQNLD